MAGLIAKPLVVEMGEQDTCFIIEDMKRAYASWSGSMPPLAPPTASWPTFTPPATPGAAALPSPWFDRVLGMER